MEAINKNKEEIEKLDKGCNNQEFGTYTKCGKISDITHTLIICSSCKRAKQERIKTSILWCEDEIEFLEEWFPDGLGGFTAYKSDGITNEQKAFNLGINTYHKKKQEIVEKKLKQLQTHLTYLKEQEKKL